MWLFYKSLQRIHPKLSKQIASNPANNRLDFGANRTITLHEIAEKRKKSCEKWQNTKKIKINTWHI